MFNILSDTIAKNLNSWGFKTVLWNININIFSDFYLIVEESENVTFIEY